MKNSQVYALLSGIAMVGALASGEIYILILALWWTIVSTFYYYKEDKQ